MARAAKRESEVARLKKEIADLRSAGQQLMAGLTEYAKESNWQEHTVEADGTSSSVEWEWRGDGPGPKTARYYLGLEQEKN